MVHCLTDCKRRGKLKKFKFRLQVVLDMRENELEKRRIEAAKILAVLNEQTIRDTTRS